MAAPNIVGVTSIYGKTATQIVTTSAASIVSNSSSSGKVLKINSLIVANVDGTNNASVSVQLFRGGVSYRLAHTIVVPADATMVILTKDSSIYLEEGDQLRLSAGASSDLEAVCSYEEIS